MSSIKRTQLPEEDDLTISTENIGGLAGRNEFQLKSGLNIIRAPNATGKSSFIHGLETAVMDESQLRDNSQYLHTFSEQGRTEIEYADENSVRRLYRHGNQLSVGGDGLYPEGGKASLFCIASEENELLERVKSARPLRSLLLRFSDAEHYDLLGDYLQQREDEARQELSEYRDELAELKRLNRELNEKKEELREKESEREQLPEIDEERLGENRELDSQLNDLLDKIEKKEESIANKQNAIEREERELTDAQNQLAKVNQRIERFNEEHPNVEQEIEGLLERESELNDEISSLKSTHTRISDDLQQTDELLVDIDNQERSTCPKCGQEVSEEEMKHRADELSQRKKELQEDIRRKQDKLNEVENRREELETERTRQKNQYQERQKTQQNKISQSENQIEDLNDEIDELEIEVEKLEGDVEDLQPNIDDEIFDLAQERSKIDREIGRIDSRIDSIQQQIEDKQGVREQIEDLRARSEFYEEAAEYMNDESEKRERAVQEMFNERIQEVYDLLDFDEPFESIQLDRNFNIKIYRRFQGQTEEDTIDTLSRSEKETVGLVLMLAGRDAYCDDFPFFIADETSFYDTARLKRIMGYIGERVPYTVITTLASADDQSDLSIEHDLSAVAP